MYIIKNGFRHSSMKRNENIYSTINLQSVLNTYIGDPLSWRCQFWGPVYVQYSVVPGYLAVLELFQRHLDELGHIKKMNTSRPKIFIYFFNTMCSVPIGKHLHPFNYRFYQQFLRMATSDYKINHVTVQFVWAVKIFSIYYLKIWLVERWWLKRYVTVYRYQLYVCI